MPALGAVDADSRESVARRYNSQTMSQTQQASGSPLPRAGSTRRCPNCIAPAALLKRWPQPDGVWQVSCSRCGHVWQERTGRSFVDTVLESRLRAITAVGLLLVAACVAVFGGYIAWMFWKLFDLGRPGVEALVVLFVAALTFTVGAAYAWRNSIDSDPSLRD
jgi:hypothetical protein